MLFCLKCVVVIVEFGHEHGCQMLCMPFLLMFCKTVASVVTAIEITNDCLYLWEEHEH